MDDTEKRPPGKMPSKLEIAMLYASRGWRVLPVWMAHDGVCTCPRGARCKDAGKHPRTRHGHEDGTTDEKSIRTWKWDTANIGIVTGPASGLLVIDNDPRNGGNETFARLVAELGELPRGPTVKTGGDGQHRYFQHPEIPIRKPADWQGIDIKSDGGMVVSPPSMHRSDKRYEWIVPGRTPLPELPEAWLHALTENSPCYRDSGACYRDNGGRQKTNGDDGRGLMTPSRRSPAAADGDLMKFIEECIQRTVPANPGKRHDSVFRLARFLQSNATIAAWKLKDLRPIVDFWYGLLAKKIGADNVKATVDENWFDFAEGWGKVKYPGEGGLMKALLERAKQNPLPQAALEYKTAELRLLVAFCRELQRETGDAPFYLATTTTQRLFGTGDRMRAWRWLKGLVIDGVLECVKRGDPAKRIASRFRYLGD